MDLPVAAGAAAKVSYRVFASILFKLIRMVYALASTERINEVMLGSNFGAVTILIDSRNLVALSTGPVDVVHH